jgi:hypothetical protein
MHLRDHPLMCYKRVRNWPPVWVRRKQLIAKSVIGEFGILAAVRYGSATPGKCHLVIEHEREEFIGALLFDDFMFCEVVVKLLEENVGRKIAEIGSIDLSFTL